MAISFQTRGKWQVVCIKGRIDSFNYQREISGKLASALDGKPPFVALDLHKAQFLSLPTIKFLAKNAAEIGAQKGECVLIGPSARMRRYIEIFGSLDNLKVFRNFEELDQGLQESPPERELTQ